MKLKFLLAGLVCMSWIGKVRSQDLIGQIPEDAEIIAAFNVKEIIQKANANKLNELLQKSGLFDRMEKRGAMVGSDIKNMGVDLSQTAYFYSRKTDSVNFTEFIFPLMNKSQFEALLKDAGDSRPFAHGYTSVALKAGSMLVYNDRVARFISATINSSFLDNDSIAGRYGIKKVEYMSPSSDADVAVADSAIAVEDYWDDAAADSVSAIVDSAAVWDEKALEVPAPPKIDVVKPDTIIVGNAEETDATFPDTTVEEEVAMHDPSYYDSLYTDYENQNKKNDSIRNVLRDKWLTEEATRLLSASYKALPAVDQSKVLKNLGLVRLYIPHVEQLYHNLVPYSSIPYYYLGMNIDKFKTGYQDGVLDLLQEGDVLKLKGSVGLDKELAAMSKRMYARKPNPKFKQYLTDKTLGFFNININSEAYLREMPIYMSKYYGGLLGAQRELVEWGLMALEIALDEKAIAQVMPGDHLVVVNGVRKFRKEYIDYTYDDDYNATEVKKTKDETLPVFIWLFTSKDQRLIKRGLDLAVSKAAGRMQDGIYVFSSKKAMDVPVYVLLKDDLVLVSNDSLALHDIRQNKMTAATNKDFVKLMKQNKMSAAFDLKKLPTMLKEIGVSPGKQWEETVAKLNEYGSTAITSKGIVGNRMEAEMSTQLPKTKEGAISYLIDQILAELNKK